MIEARGLTKRYGSVLAVDGADFDVRPGVVTGFLGPNGAGKSTTMRLILGLDRPTSGTVTVNGRPFNRIGRPIREVGALLEGKAVHQGRSAYAHLLCIAASNGVPAKRVDEVLELVGLTGIARRRIGKLSLGMGQRLGIAAALLGDPNVLMFDEPVNGLDPEGIAWIRNLLKSLAAEGRTVFVSSHLMSEMALTADHLIVIGRGRVLADMGMQEFIRGSSQNYVRVRSPRLPELRRLVVENRGEITEADDGSIGITGLTIEAIGDLAAANGIPLHELVAQQASLEEAFMEATRDSVEYQGAPAEPGPAMASASSSDRPGA